ncbi:MAG: hypothetical protein Q7T29_15195 [Gallionella sp.]|nr:hypothetical protein [Gallionella sp.]
MKLPNGASAVVDIEKLQDYCLSSEHPEGRHKARVFLSALVMETSLFTATANSRISRNLPASADVIPSADKYGCRYSMDVVVTWGSREALVRSAWIVKAGEEFPRLASCYVLRGAV